MGSLKKPMTIAGVEKNFKEPLQKCLRPETLKENCSTLKEQIIPVLTKLCRKENIFQNFYDVSMTLTSKYKNTTIYRK